MKPILISEVAAAIGSEQTADQAVTSVCTDTRSLIPGCLFVAISGENFDGHDYIPAALEQGAAFVVSHKKYDHPQVLQVTDTRKALLEIAGYYRKFLGIKVAAVTGSVGKTTTKEMTACLLESEFKTLKTPANLNNEVGVSQTIFMLNDHAAAMLELGIDGPGQMKQMAVAAAPDLSIVTGIGVAHLAQLGSRQGILREKLDIRAGMADGATLLLNGDNDLLSDFEDSRLKILRYGMENPRNDIVAKGLRQFEDKTEFEIIWEGRCLQASLPAIGSHNVMNALAAFAAGVSLGVPQEKAVTALEGYRPEGMRQRVVECGGYTVVEDCYNSSPDSAKAALTTLAGMKCEGKKIAVFADMLELGPTEREDHFDIGRFAGGCGIDLLLCTGSLSQEYPSGAKGTGLETVHYPDKAALLAGIKERSAVGDILWFKASRGIKLEETLKGFYAEM